MRMTGSRFQRWWIFAAAGCVVALSVGGFAYATSSSSRASTIHGCYSETTGVLRIAETCRSDELAISWNASGQTGAPGATGPRGPEGPAGKNGTPGAKGATGAVGAPGATGTQGPTGATGATGATGIDGSTWYSGSGTPSSATGSDGDYYLETSTDDVFEKTSGSWGAPIATLSGPTGSTGAMGVPGPTGAQGPAGATGATGIDGSTWYSGSSAPSGATGSNGDYYFDTTTDDVYEKTSGSWGSPIANLTGPAGATGSQGPQGAQGPEGPEGPVGPTGPAGGATVLWAQVSSTGVLGFNNGVDSVTNPSTGHYQVTFDQDVSQCAYVVTPSESGANEASAYQELGGSEVDVFLHDDLVGVAASFSIAVFC
jgi:hypothetical protein